MLLGGGERPGRVMERIVALAGGAEARFLVVPLGHPEPEDAAATLVRELETAGAGRAELLSFDRETADGWEVRQRVRQASGIFFGGGDAAKLAGALSGTELEAHIHELYRRGGVVAGTSAGATVLGEAMILGPVTPGDPDRAVPAIRAGALAVEPGLALLPGVIVDQHFLVRRRQNRLLAALLENPGRLGIGIDEATAIVVGPGDRLEVLGEGLVAIYDLSAASDPQRDARGNLAASGVVLHLLASGQRFDLVRREVQIP